MMMRRSVLLMMKSWGVLTLALLCVKQFAAAAPAISSLGATNAGVGRFIVISDLHYDGSLQATQAFPVVGKQDSNLRLVESALRSARSNCPNPMFIFCPGDVLAHFNQRVHPFVNQAQAEQSEVADLFRAVFPNVPVFVQLGNNDSDVDNQVQPPAFLAAFSNAWFSTIFTGVPESVAKRASEGLLTAGYYAAELPGLSHHRLLALNSTHFDSQALDHSQAPAQMQWLRREVASARAAHERVWLLFHIPPGVDPYKGTLFWDQTFQPEFLKLVADNTDVITAIFCGHTHRDEFRVVHRAGVPVSFIHIAPSVSPIYYDYPAYQIFQVNTNTAELLDCTTCYLSKTFEWRGEYSFCERYGVTNYSLASLAQVENKMERGEAADIASYRKFYSVSDVTGESPALTNFTRYLGYLKLEVGK